MKTGKTIHFGDIYAKGITLVYFYPKAGTPGCTAEACSLRDAYEKLEGEGVQVIGVSRDKVAKQKQFKDQYNLPFTLIRRPGGQGGGGVRRAADIGRADPARFAAIVSDQGATKSCGIRPARRRRRAPRKFRPRWRA